MHAAATSGMDTGGRTSRKKQFKPAVDDALQGGWVVPTLEVEAGEGVPPLPPMPLLRTTSTTQGQVLTREYGLEWAEHAF